MLPADFLQVVSGESMEDNLNWIGLIHVLHFSTFLTIYATTFEIAERHTQPLIMSRSFIAMYTLAASRMERH